MSTSPAPTAPQPAAAPSGLRQFATKFGGPLVLGAVAVVGAAVLFAWDPGGRTRYPLCPFHAITGLDCPGCGMTRGLHDLLHGDVLAALDHNVLLLIAVPVAVTAFVAWVRRIAGRTAARWVITPRWAAAILTVGVLFWVVRNLPGVPFLPAA